MFQVVPEPEFSAWYETLPEPLAEEVATAIDVAASASNLLAPERLSRFLLWFDGTSSGSGASGLPGELSFERLWPELPLARAQSYLMWHQEVTLCLESAPFRERLERLDAALAAQALAEVERLKQRLRAARLGATWSPWRPQGAPTTRGAHDVSSLRAAFLDLLGVMGLDVEVVLGSGSGLRELRIDNVQPSLRVLFGLDFPARRLIAILGEALDRRYYGDSVKRAEARWQSYCASRARELVSP